MQTRIVIIGSGNVAEAFAMSIAQNGLLELIGIVARNEQRRNEIALKAGCKSFSLMDRLPVADAYIVAVSDKAVPELCSALDFPEHAIIAHTAGSCRLEDIPSRYEARAVIYPFQGFSRGREVDLREVPFFIEAAPKHLQQVRTLAEKLSKDVREADSATRGVIHMAGVFANNFANEMFAIANDVVSKAGFDFSVLCPLILETASKAVDSMDPAAVQTGPAIRQDHISQQRHLNLLDGNEELKDIYNKISDSIWHRKISRKD